MYKIYTVLLYRVIHVHLYIYTVITHSVYTCMPWWEFSFVYFLMEEGRGGGLAGRRGIDGFGGLD